MQEIVLFSPWLFKRALQHLRDFILLKYICFLLSKLVILFVLSFVFFFLAIKELIHLRGNKNSLEYL